MTTKLTDREAKAILSRWPLLSKKLWPPPQGKGNWIRGQPVQGTAPGPRIGSPGARLFLTQPDGLYVYFNNIESCDVVAVESCGTVQNLNDKRSRYVHASHSLILNCGKKWFLEDVVVQGRNKTKPRWKACQSITTVPEVDLGVPIRFMRVLYALPNTVYKLWCGGHIPTGYEYFCPHSALGSYNSQKMQTFLARMSLGSQFYLKRF